jgi:hypothetical protein
MLTPQELEDVRAAATVIFPNLNALEDRVELVFRIDVAILVIVSILVILAIINIVGTFGKRWRAVQE